MKKVTNLKEYKEKKRRESFCSELIPMDEIRVIVEEEVAEVQENLDGLIQEVKELVEVLENNQRG